MLPVINLVSLLYVHNSENTNPDHGHSLFIILPRWADLTIISIYGQ